MRCCEWFMKIEWVIRQHLRVEIELANTSRIARHAATQAIDRPAPENSAYAKVPGSPTSCAILVSEMNAVT